MMRTRHSAFLAILALLPILVSGCVAPAQPVTTVWQKLGIPQATTAIRDHLSNPLGNNPDAERKPPLKRIADAGALDPENKLLTGAAEVKKQEDLAPQKIKALKFLGGIGCCCYDEMEDAFLAGLGDCTPEVRLAAIEAIENSTTKTIADMPERRCCIGKRERDRCIECKICDELKKKRQKNIAERRAKHEAFRQCIRCRGRGCGGCEVGGTCCGCNCMSCCTEAIQKVLKEMAFGTDEHGCFTEPVEEVRNAAAALLAICPPIPEKPDDNGGNGGNEDLPPGETDTNDDAGAPDDPVDTATEVPILRYSHPHPGIDAANSFSQSLFDTQAKTIAEPASLAMQPKIEEAESSEPKVIAESINKNTTIIGEISNEPGEIKSTVINPHVPTEEIINEPSVEQIIEPETDSEFPPIVTSEPVGEGMLTAEVTAVDRLLSQVDFKFDAEYEIPIGSTVLIKMDDKTEIEMKVIDSIAAKLTARYDMEDGQLLSPGQIASVGILSVHQD